MMVLGTLGACAVGSGLPLNFIIFSTVVDKFLARGSLDYTIANTKVNATKASNATVEPFLIYGSIFDVSKWFLILSGCLFFCAFVQMVCWQYAAQRQVMRIRTRLFTSMIYQDLAWHDERTTGDLVTRLSDQVGAHLAAPKRLLSPPLLLLQVNTIQLAIGDKMAIFLQYFATFLSGVTLGFIRGWRLTLVVFAGMPLLALSIASVGLVMKRLTQRQMKSYGVAGSIAEEVLSSVRTVVAFGGERKEAVRWAFCLSSRTPTFHLSQRKLLFDCSAEQTERATQLFILTPRCLLAFSSPL